MRTAEEEEDEISWIFKIFKNRILFRGKTLKFRSSRTLPWGQARSHKFWPDRFSRFDVYWIQKDNRQAKYIYMIYFSSYILILYSHPIFSSYILLLYSHPIFSSYILLLYSHPIFSSYILILYSPPIFSSSIFILYSHPRSSCFNITQPNPPNVLDYLDRREYQSNFMIQIYILIS